MNDAAIAPGWGVYFTRKMLLIGVLGFFSGLPLALTASTLTAWLADSGVDRASIGLFAAITTPYALKFLWAPVMDGLQLPLLNRLGRRRGWMLLIQLFLSAAIACMAFIDPATTPGQIALIGLVIATLSASQDIVIDAYRVERLEGDEQAAGAAMVTFGYRTGMLISGAGALALADIYSWQQAYIFMSMVMGISMLVTLLARSPKTPDRPEIANAIQTADKPSLRLRMQHFMRYSVIAPFADFTRREHWLAVLLFVVLYKLGDAFMGVMFNPFLLDIGFAKIQIAEIVKLYGLAATILGAFAGGAMVARYGMFRTLIGAGLVHMLTNFMLVAQALRGADEGFLILSISLENFSGGISTAAFIGYLSALCNKHYTATQYALLTSMASFGRTILSTPSGLLAQSVGWPIFFALSSLLAIPSLGLLWWLEKKQRRAKTARTNLRA
jgi:PAT family beta-lactamase induction signal transducer AmpG